MTILASISDPALVAVIALVGTLVAAGISAYASRRQGKATLDAAEAQNQVTLKVAEAQNRTTLEIAKAQNESAHEEGGRVRFANWQLKKREVYAEFLERARAHRDDTSNQEAENEFFFHAHRSMLFSNKELRAELWSSSGTPIACANQSAGKHWSRRSVRTPAPSRQRTSHLATPTYGS